MVGKYQPLTLAPINFSLTEGTQIPAPPESPPETPRPPTPGKGPLDSHPTPPQQGSAKSADSSQHQSTLSNGENSGTLSPTSPVGKRPGSVRKFLGLRPLSSSDSLRSERPGSPATIDSRQGLTRKRSSGWFGRRKSSFMGGPLPEMKENSAPQGNGAQVSDKTPPAKQGPPPPALPSLSAFGVSEETTSLGAEDLFKNIN
ncbi:uncharacterized protein EI97DRAFT_429587 [Westerdykella ornata]|uniref:Uncharacterized protein n=1 Tax=Westerdykella ornata TaxID=318751 RepID=A0A6A6JZS0_WESOR|nr:uncharacterized protein EI97DRAFT_429587 [Westerdykella ornata]KAF2281583.1 hypothetical protein EI97DRAFT_429587 [Westerdykella ornata]